MTDKRYSARLCNKAYQVEILGVPIFLGIQKSLLISEFNDII